MGSLSLAMGKILVLYERNSPGASLNQRRFFIGSHDLKSSRSSGMPYPAAQMLSHPAHLLAQFSSVGRLNSQPAFSADSSLSLHQHGNTQGKKVPLVKL